MTETTLHQRILMASDISARYDRALARAALLALAWQSELTVAHVVHAAEVAQHDRLTNGTPSWRRPESRAQSLERALRTDMVAEGVAPPWTPWCALARARSNVRRRARSAYRHIVVATEDVSPG